jgi:exodeoxyribonuclease VII large subunit
MSEGVNDRKVFSLSQVTLSIQKTLASRYTSSFWVQAEMIKLHYYPQSGHCYPELVEKKNGRVVAQMKANLWKDDYLRINTRFLQILKEPLKEGINILFCAKITFEPVHGISLRILDIDPVFSLGELEREKQETISRLSAEGIFDRNKQVKLALLPQRIAIISVQTSKGYADFLKVIEANPWGYRFFHFLFPSLLQGDNAVESIRFQLSRIGSVQSHFDAVAIIRGGGGDIGLSCFNNLMLARDIALFPIPVISGIGHATNETVAEMVAYKNAITPTELADFLLQKFHNFSVPVQKAGETLQDKIHRIVKDEKTRFQEITKYFRSLTGGILLKNRNDLKNNSRTLQQHSKFIVGGSKEHYLAVVREMRKGVLSLCADARRVVGQLTQDLKKDTASSLHEEGLTVHQANYELRAGADRLAESSRMRLDHLERSVKIMDPMNVLKRGYSITRLNGSALRNAAETRNGDIIETNLFEGKIESEVKSVTKNPGS